MPASAEDIALAKAYEPILVFHPQEPYQPVDAKRWFEACALWPANAEFTDKAKWGFGRAPSEPFPRSPLLKRGQASLLSGETKPDETDVTTNPGSFLQTQGGEKELFLEFDGWADSDDVTQNTANQSADLMAVKTRTDGDEFLPFRLRYASEILQTSAIETLIKFIRRDLDFSTLIKDIFEAPRLVLYYIFYPGHDEELLGCQTVPANGRNANFSGDWACVAILFDAEVPKWIGHSTHNAGPIEDAFKDLRIGMLINDWNQARLIGNHPVIFVAKGTHGNYLSPGDKTRPSFSPVGTDISKKYCGAIEDAYNLARDAAKIGNELISTGETAKDWLVVLAKVVAGALIGGPLGALVGAVAGLIEALATTAPNVSVPPPLPANDPLDQAPPKPAPNQILAGRVLKPAGLVLPPDIQSSEIQDWDSNEKQVDGRTYPFVVRRNEQPWWPGDQAQHEPPGYEGRWGVRVQQDPVDRRCGMVFPQFRSIFFRELLLTLSK